jgi:hypothetical protein
MFNARLRILAAGQISVRQMSVASGAWKRTCENRGSNHDCRCGFRRWNGVQEIQGLLAHQGETTRRTTKEVCVEAVRTTSGGQRDYREIAKATADTETSSHKAEAKDG